MIGTIVSHLWLAGLGVIVVASVLADALRGFPEQDDGLARYDPFDDWSPK